MNKVIRFAIIIALSSLFFAGCSQNQPIPTITHQKQHNYQVFTTGIIIQQEKVLMSNKYETYLEGMKKEQKEMKKVLYKTIIGSENKNFTIFIDKKIAIGRQLQFIKEKNGSISHISLKI